MATTRARPDGGESVEARLQPSQLLMAELVACGGIVAEEETLRSFTPKRDFRTVDPEYTWIATRCACCGSHTGTGQKT